nr:hypothetical protein [Tanacetum cinerariifolium]
MNGGYVAFGGNPNGGKISGKGKIKTGKLDFEDVYFVKELKFNLFSVSQMCNKKNKVLFTDSECLVLSLEFKLPDESQVLLRVPRENNMYNVNLKDIVPSVDLTCLFVKATIDESNLWHRRLGHINYKTINKLSILKTFITGQENQLSLKVKEIRSDNGTEFKNSDLNQFCGLKGIKREFSIPRIPQQNGIAERKNMTLIEAARTMLADSLLTIPFWAEAVNTACYVTNRVLVNKPHNKTLYELLHGRTPSISFIRLFGCLVTIFNTLDPLVKFEGKVDEGFLVGYSVNSKAFRVFNSITRIVQETLHVNFLENKPNIAGTGPTWLFDIDSLTRTMNYQPVTAGNQSNPSAGFQGEFDAEKAGEEANQQYMLFLVWSTGSLNPQNKEGDAAFDGKEHDAEKSESAVNLSPSGSALSGEQDDITKKKDKGKSPIEYFTVPAAKQNYSSSTNPISVTGPSNTSTSPTHGTFLLKDASQPPDMLEMEDMAYSDHENVGAEADFNNLETSIIVSFIPTTRTHKAHPISQIIGDLNKKDERGIVFRNKARLVAQGHTQEEGINYEDVFAPVARIEAIRLFLAYASFIGFMVYQIDVKSAFLYGIIEEEVYVCQPLGFEDPDHPEKVYKVVKVLYGLHQAPRAWYETLANYLLENGFHKGQIDQTLFIKKQKGDILLVQIYVKQKKDGIFISQDTYVAEILKKFGLTKGKSASTHIDIEKPLLKDPDGEDVDVNIYRLISWQCKKQTVVATSSTEAEYVAGASCFAQVLWIQNQMLDYGHKLLLFSLTNWCCSISAVRSSIKQHNNVTRLQALVDKKKVVVTEATIREALRLDDAEGVDCLPNEEIFTELARMGYEKPSTKLTFYKAFFSSHSAMASTVIFLSTDRKFNFSKYIFDSLVRNVDSSSKFYMYHRRLGKGCSGVETPLFKGVLVARKPEEQVAQDLEITKLKTRVKNLERANKVKALKLRRLRKVGTSQRIESSDDTIMEDVSNQGRMINELDRDKVEGRQTDIYQINMDHAAKVLNMQEDKPEVQEAVEVVTTAKLITEVVAAVSETVVVVPSTRRRRGVVIRDLEEESSAKTLAKTKSKDKGKDDDVYTEATPLARKVPVVNYQIIQLNNKPHFKIIRANETHQLYVSFITLLKNFDKEDLESLWSIVKERYFTSKPNNFSDDFLLTTLKEMFGRPDGQDQSKEQLEEEENRAIESINETLAQKAAKRRRLNKEAEDVEELR